MRFLRLFQSLILRDLWMHRTRTLLAVAGVAVGIAAVVGVRLANTRAIDSFGDSLRLLGGRADLQISANGLPIDEQLIGELAWVWEHGSMSPLVQGRTRIATTDTVASSIGTIQVFGIDLLSEAGFRQYIVGDGSNLALDTTPRSFIDLLLDPRKVIVPQTLARRLNIATGSTLSLLIADRQEELEVGALLGDRDVARAFGGNILFMDIAAAQLLFGQIGRLDRIDILLDDPSELQTVEARIREQLPPTTIVHRPEDSVTQSDRMLRAFRYNLNALGYVALIVGIILIHNTVSIAVVRRQSEIGTLRALGTTRWTIGGMFLAEALLFGILGAGLGFALGGLLAQGAEALVSETVESLYTGLPSGFAGNGMDLDLLLEMLVLGGAMAIFSGAGPALGATEVSPVASLRSRMLAFQPRRSHRNMATAGLVVVLGGTLLSLGPPLNGFPVLGYAAVLCFIGGLALLTPILARALLRLVGPPVRRMFGVEGRLAVRTTESGLGRLVIAVVSLMIAVSMLVSVATMVSSFRNTVVTWTNQSLRADLYVRAAAAGQNDWGNPLGSTTVATIDRLDEVAAVDRFQATSIDFRGQPATLAAGDFHVLEQHGNLLFAENRSISDVAPRLIDQDRVIISEPLALRHNIKVAERLQLPTRDGTRLFVVEAIYYDYSSDHGLIVMDRRTYLRHFSDERVNSLSIYLKPGADVTRARMRIAQELPGAKLRISANSELKRQVLRVFDQTFQVTYALEVIAIIVAILGIANTLAALILERRAEIAILRIVGADRFQIRKMVLLESALTGVLGTALGCALGMALSFVLIYVINRQSFGWTIQFGLPAGFLAASLALLLFATLAAGLYPALLATRMDPAQAVRAE